MTVVGLVGMVSVRGRGTHVTIMPVVLTKTKVEGYVWLLAFSLYIGFSLFIFAVCIR